MKFIRNLILVFALLLPGYSLAEEDSVYTSKKKATDFFEKKNPYVSFLFSLSFPRFGIFDP